MNIRLDIKPMASPRPRVSKFGTYMPKSYTLHKEFVKYHISDKKKYNVPLEVEFLFCFKTPKSVKRNKYPLPIGDIDNFVKTYLDAMEGIVYDNDTLVNKITAKKMWSDVDAVLIKVKKSTV